MKRPPRPTLPAALEAAYALWLWLDARVTAWPATVRPALGAAVLATVLALLDALTRAAFTPRADPALRGHLVEANHRVAFLRLLLRGATAQRHLSPDQHAYASQQLEPLGRTLGGWIRALDRSRTATP